MVIHAEKYLESVLLAKLIANSGIFLAICQYNLAAGSKNISQLIHSS